MVACAPARATPGAMSMRVLAALTLSFAAAACGGPVEETDSASSEEALRRTLPAGHYAIGQEPSSGSYIKSLTIKPTKKFELEYVRVTTRNEPWVWNPWLTVPTANKESMLLRGTYLTYAGVDGKPTISFDFAEGAIDHLIYDLEVDGDTLRLKATGERAFELVLGEDAPQAVDKRVVSCDGRRWDVTIAFEDPERRRGVLTVKRGSGAQANDPKSGNVTVVYNGNTGVDDYMGFEGTDSAGGRYEFALRRSDLARTSGAISNVGLGYSAPYTSYFMHNSLGCTIAAR